MRELDSEMELIDLLYTFVEDFGKLKNKELSKQFMTLGEENDNVLKEIVFKYLSYYSEEDIQVPIGLIDKHNLRETASELRKRDIWDIVVELNNSKQEEE